MKKMLTLFLSFFILFACGEKTDQNTDSTTENTVEASTTSQNTEPEVENLNGEDNNKQKNASLDEVASILDYFEVRKKTLLGQGMNPKIVVKDPANGYLRYESDMGGGAKAQEEMAYFICENNKKFVAIFSSNIFKSPSGESSFSGIELPKFYELRGGELVEATENYLSVEERGKMNAGIPFMGGEGAGMINYWAKLPQQGLNIKVGQIVENQVVEAGELRFNKKTCSFAFFKR